MNDIITLGQARPEAQKKFMTGVYLRMFLALVVTAAVAWYTANTPRLVRLLFLNNIIWVTLVAELILVLVLSAKIGSLSLGAASALFYVYAVLNGVNLSSIFFAYQIGSIVNVFIASAAMFLAMTLYGMFTKSSLASYGKYLYMGLVGLIVASLLNFIFHSSTMEWAISVVGIGIFIGLTAYDTQKFMSIGLRSDESENFQKIAIIGALELYLDFINIFLKMLRLFGKRR